MPNRIVPTKLKILRGNPGKRPLNELEPQPDELESLPNPPAWLDKAAKRLWNDLGPVLLNLGLLTVADRETFAILCDAYSTTQRMSARLAKDGEIVETPNGSVQVHPAVSIKREAQKLYATYCGKFGCSPGDRPKVKVNGNKDKETALDKLIAAKRKQG